MKTKFYKRLVPIALIASMAVTNVGMTSASAQEVTAGFTQTVDAQDVGASIPASANVEFASASAESGTVAITITGRDNEQTDASKYELWAGSPQAQKISTNSELAGDTVTFTINATSFGEGTEINNVTVYYMTTPSATSIGTVKLNKTIKQASPTPTQQQAAASGFQIPGGLTAKADAQTGYTVGIAKVSSDATDLAAGNVCTTDVKEARILASTWGSGEKSAANGYVLYYATDKTPDVATNVKFIRKLTTAEVEKLPLGAFKTDVTGYTDVTAEGATDSEQYKIEHSTATVTGQTFKSMKDLFDIVFATNNNSAFGVGAFGGQAGFTAPTGANANSLDAVAVPSPNPNSHVLVPAIGDVAADDILIKDEKFVEAVIAAYDDGKAESAKFAKQEEAGDPATPWVEIKEENGKKTYSFSNKGKEELFKFFETDNYANAKKYMTADGVKEKTKKLYEAIYARAKALYINAYNDKVAADGPVLDNVQWVMETMKEQSGKDAKGKDVFSKASGSAKFWGRAASLKKTKTGTEVVEAKDASAATRVKGATALVSNTKAAGKFNAAVYLKAVKPEYTTPKKNALSADNVIISEGFFVPPAVPSAFKTLDVSSTKAGSTLGKNDAASTAAAASGYAKVYDLVLDVGKSYKLPFALADGSEKDLVYKVGTGSAGFTVIGGKVTGTDANAGTAENNAALGANTVEVYSRANPAVKVLVNVKVNASVKSVRANTTALAIWPGSVQTVSLGTVPATKPGDFKYEVSCSDTTNIELKQINASNEPADLTGGKFVEGNLLQVSVATGKKAADVKKNTTITVTLCDSEGKAVSSGGKEVKPLVIKLNPATAPQDVKSIKTAVKSKETDAYGHKVINIPVGGAYNVGYSVSPATANGTIKFGEQDGNNAASVSGDVIKGENVGHEQITFEVADDVKISDSFKSNEAEPTDGAIVYDVNVYEPGASIVLTDSDYTIKGGFLMTTSAADTDCNKTFIAGKKYIMSLPKTACTAGDGEEIVWTANNPAAVKFVEYTASDADVNASTGKEGYKGKTAGKYLEITPCQTGTFTITGTTKYTKQKLAFKMLVGAANSAAATDNGTLDFSAGNVTPAEVNTPLDVAIGAGNKINAYYSSGTEDVGGTVTFALKTATDKDKLTVSKTGLITAKSAGKVTVVATMMKDKTTKLCEKEFTVTVTAANVTPKSVIEATKIAGGTTVGAAKGAKLSVALNNFDKKTMQLVWYTMKATGDTIELVNDNKNKLSGEVKPAAADDYKVYVRAFKSDASITAANVNVANDNACGEPICLGTVRVYAKGIKSADTNNGDKDTKTAIAALGAKVDENKPANAAGNGHTYYFPVFVKGTSDTDVPDAAKADAKDMTFTVSNKSLATKVEFIPKSQDISTELKSTAENKMQDTDIVKNYTNAYGFIKVETAAAPGEGAEALSGVVTIKGTLVNSNKAVTLKLNLTGAAKDPATPYAPVEVTKGTPKTDATFSGVTKLAGDEIANLQNALNEATGKTVTEYKWVIVKPNSKKYTKDDIAEGFTLGAVNVNETTKVATVATIDAASAVKEGTYYLAKETIIHKIKTAYVAASGDKEAVNAVEDTKAAKYTVELASKTPILVSAAATTGGGTSDEGDNTNTDTGDNNG